MESGIQYLQSKIHSVKSRIQDYLQAVLDYHTQGDRLFAHIKHIPLIQNSASDSLATGRSTPVLEQKCHYNLRASRGGQIMINVFNPLAESLVAK